MQTALVKRRNNMTPLMVKDYTNFVEVEGGYRINSMTGEFLLVPFQDVEYILVKTEKKDSVKIIDDSQTQSEVSDD